MFASNIIITVNLIIFWILCVFRSVFVSFASRSPWPQGAKTGGGLSEPSNHLLKGTHKWKKIRREPDAAQLSFSSFGQTARTEDSMHTRPTAHLLSKTGGPGPPSSDSGENLHGYAAVLKIHEQKFI